MPSDYQKQFGGTEVQHSVRGVRSWCLDKYYRLLGLRNGPWRPGENVAHCVFPQIRLEDGLAVWSGKHEVSDPKCECGFYAYFGSPLNNLLIKGVRGVIGVIEGYGKTTVGPLGFRSEKAKILAMYPFKLEHNWSTPEQADRFRHLLSPEDASLFRFPLKLDLLSHTLKPLGFDPLDSLKRRFPDVAMFRDYSTMISEFPTTTAGRFE